MSSYIPSLLNSMDLELTNLDLFSPILVEDDPNLNDAMNYDFERDYLLQVNMADDQPVKISAPPEESSAVIPLCVLEHERMLALADTVHAGEAQLPLEFTTNSVPEDYQAFDEVSIIRSIAATSSTTALPGLGNVPATAYCGSQLIARTSPSFTSTVSTCYSPSQLLNVVSRTLADHEVPRSPEGQCEGQCKSDAAAAVGAVSCLLSPALPTYEQNFDVTQYQESIVLSSVTPQGQGPVKRGRPPVRQMSCDPVVEKKERRRKQNRDAADRCRKKRRLEFEQLKKSYDAAIEDNKKLTNDVETFKQLCRTAFQQLLLHQQHCDLQLPASLNQLQLQ